MELLLPASKKINIDPSQEIALTDQELVSLGRAVVIKEADGLKQLEASLGQDFIKAVKLLSACEGRVITTGMGKSGHIATKAAATIASTGTLATFIHPAEASHGDLGMIDQRDIVIALSNSGETKELSDIITYCHTVSIPLIALTQNSQSNLARYATVTLLIPSAEEACPIALAPSTSTTMMLALMDALALTLHSLKGFTPKDFKKFHPGGKLGSVLVSVRDLMIPKDRMPLVKETDKMKDVIILISQGRLGCVGVVNDAGQHIGIITDGDLRRHLSEQMLDQKAGDIMSCVPKEISEEELAADALRKMRENKITSLLVTDRAGQLVGMIDIHKCLEMGLGA
tara:strand:+ start:397 stop:1422 length:1026 start_codon:yes stop_codon:yes gene_type:complete